MVPAKLAIHQIATPNLESNSLSVLRGPSTFQPPQDSQDYAVPHLDHEQRVGVVAFIDANTVFDHDGKPHAICMYELASVLNTDSLSVQQYFLHTDLLLE